MASLEMEQMAGCCSPARQATDSRDDLHDLLPAMHQPSVDPAHTARQLRQQCGCDRLCVFRALERLMRYFVRQLKGVPSISGLLRRDRVRTVKRGRGACLAPRRLVKSLPPRFYHHTCCHVLASGGSGALETELKATSGPWDGLDVHCVDGLTNWSRTQLQAAQLVARSTGHTQGDNTPIEATRA